MRRTQIDEITHFFKNIIDPQIALWKTQYLCHAIDYSDESCIRISFIGYREERLYLNIEWHSPHFYLPQTEEEHQTHFVSLDGRKIVCKRYTICCKTKTQAKQVIQVFNSLYNTQFV